MHSTRGSREMQGRMQLRMMPDAREWDGEAGPKDNKNEERGEKKAAIAIVIASKSCNVAEAAHRRAFSSSGRRLHRTLQHTQSKARRYEVANRK
eukprot:6199609-Pleurochrysis_carterae.AAC.7